MRNRPRKTIEREKQMKNILNRKSAFMKLLSVWTAFSVAAAASWPAFAGTVVLGGASELADLTRVTMDSNTPDAAVFSSTAPSGVLDWTKFNIGTGQSMTFNGAATTFFNLVDGAAGKSQIDGIINGSGNVWVINPAGVAFGASSKVDLGSLFVAAAGNVENATALRTGTAALPEFSSFNGEVSTAASSAFTAGQVALLGKSVSASGDFTGVSDLSIGASRGSMAVDDVVGGKVSVNIGDFAVADAEVSLGDLDIGGSLSVKSAGSIVTTSSKTSADSDKPMLRAVTKTGSVIQAGDIDMMAYNDLEVDGKLQSTAGNVSLLAYGDLDINSDVDAYGSVSAQALEDVNISANVTARGGETGAGGATVYAYNGNVTVNEGVTVASVGSVDITAGMGSGANGNVKIDGSVTSTAGNIALYSGYGDGATGDVTINGNVSAAGGVDAYAGFGYAMGTDGMLTVNGNVSGVNSVNLRTGNGDIAIGKNAVVEATGDYSEVNLYTAADAGYGVMSGDGHAGNIVIDGTVRADTGFSLGNVNIVAGKETGATGSVELNGKVAADFYAQIGTRTGGVTVNGEMKSNGEVALSTHDGGITVSESGKVLATGDYELYGINGTVGMYAAMDAGGTGNVEVKGQVVAGGANGAVTMTAGYNAETPTSPGGSGQIVLDGAITAQGGLSAYGESVSLTQDEAINLGSVMATQGDVTVITGRGELTVLEGGNVSAANGDVVLQAAQQSDAVGGWLEVSDGAAVTGNRVFLGVGTDYAYDPLLGDFNYNGTGGSGDLYVGGQVTGSERAMIGTSNGSIQIGESGHVATLTAGSELDVEAAVYQGGVGSVIVDGSVNSAGIAYLSTASGGSGKGNIEINQKGQVSADGDAYLYAGQGDIDWNTYSLLESWGDVIVDGKVQANNIDVQAGYNLGMGAIAGAGSDGSQVKVGSSGQLDAANMVSVFGVDKVQHNGMVTAINSVSMRAFGGVSGQGGVDVASGNLSVSGGMGAINLSGVVKAKDASFTTQEYAAYGNVSDLIVDNDANDFTGTVTAEGRNVILADENSLTVGNVLASGGGVQLRTNGGDLTVNQGGAVSASGASGVHLRARDGRIVVQQNASVMASGGDAILETVTADDVTTPVNIEVAGTISGSKRVFLGANVLDDGAAGEKVLVKGSGNVVISGSVSAQEKISAFTAEGDVKVGKTATVELSGDNASAYLSSAIRTGAHGNVLVEGKVSASGEQTALNLSACGQGNIEVSGSVMSAGDASVRAMNDGNISVSGTVQGGGKVAVSHSGNGNLTVSGTVVSETDAEVYHARNGDVLVSGHVSAKNEASVTGAMNDGTYGNVKIDGSVIGGKSARVYTGDGMVTVNGIVTSKDETYVAAGIRGDSTTGGVSINGTVSANGPSGNAYALAGLSANDVHGDISFGTSGQLSASDGVHVIANRGSVQQAGATLPDAREGQVNATSFHAAMSGKTVNVKAGGNIGSGKNGFVAVDGKAYVEAGGDVSIAAANGGNLKGGPGVGSVDTAFGKITFGDLNGNSNIKAGGDLSVYTAGKIESSGLLQAGGGLTVSASDFGDVSYLQAGGMLTINNVGKQSSPKIAYFESVNGIEPNINNQPNDTVIFIDGRLAGGNLNILNEFGSDEAFMVNTPELKSTQGIFGSPTFVHSDLDVANPMEVGSIDYMLQETPRLTLDKDFPKEADQHVDSVVIPERDSIQFGRGAKNGESAPNPDGKIAKVK